MPKVGAPLNTQLATLGQSWSNDIVDVECDLEEYDIPFRLRSLPLLSELLYNFEAAEELGAQGVGLMKRTRRDRSLGILTQRFIKVFLLGRKVVTLNFAAPVVIPDEEEDADLSMDFGDCVCPGSQITGHAGASSSTSMAASKKATKNKKEVTSTSIVDSVPVDDLPGIT
jgi:hypothetical protein